MVLKKVYQVSQKGKNPQPRFFLQHLICEAAGWKPKDTLYVHTNEEENEVTVQNTPFQFENSEKESHMKDRIHEVSVSYRENKNTGQLRPLVDTAGDRYRSIVDIKQKVEMCVYKGKVVIRPLQYNLMENATTPTHSDQRIRLTSIGAGAGVGTSVFQNTGYFTPVMEIELEQDSAEVLKHNFPNSFLFNGDLRDCHDVMESDVVLATLPCNEHSNLGFGDEGIGNNIVLATVKLIESSKSKAVVFENVPQFYKSKAFQSMKEMLMDKYPYWIERNIESLDFGSLARRDRTYAVAFTHKEMFLNFEFPAPAKNQRKRKLRDYVDSFKECNYEWKSLEKWTESFNSREAWKDRKLDKTFVTMDAKEIQCIPKRYRSQCASNTYVLNSAKDKWRFLTESEIRKILSIPEWFQFCSHTPITRRFEMLGQSVDGRVISAIANNLATTFMKTKDKLTSTAQTVKNTAQEFISINENGQFELAL